MSRSISVGGKDGIFSKIPGKKIIYDEVGFSRAVRHFLIENEAFSPE